MCYLIVQDIPNSLSQLLNNNGALLQLTRVSRNMSSAHARTLRTPTPDVLEVW